MNDLIVVGIDGSENSSQALEWAVAEANLRNGRVLAVMCWSYLGITDSEMGVGTTEADAGAVLEEIIGQSAADQSEIIDRVLLNDLAVPGLLSQLGDAAMVVVGSRGRSGLKSLMLGSVSRAVVEQSPVPVVVIPHQPRY